MIDRVRKRERESLVMVINLYTLIKYVPSCSRSHFIESLLMLWIRPQTSGCNLIRHSWIIFRHSDAAESKKHTVILFRSLLLSWRSFCKCRPCFHLLPSSIFFNAVSTGIYSQSGQARSEDWVEKWSTLGLRSQAEL